MVLTKKKMKNSEKSRKSLFGGAGSPTKLNFESVESGVWSRSPDKLSSPTKESPGKITFSLMLSQPMLFDIVVVLPFIHNHISVNNFKNK